MKCPEIVQVAHDEHAQVHKGQNSRKSPQDKLGANEAEWPKEGFSANPLNFWHFSG